jgi:hypothetical protein
MEEETFYHKIDLLAFISYLGEPILGCWNRARLLASWTVDKKEDDEKTQ